MIQRKLSTRYALALCARIELAALSEADDVGIPPARPKVKRLRGRRP
jgi:hypothetical protein